MKTKVLFVDANDPFSEIENRYHPLWPASLAAYATKNIYDRYYEFTYCSDNKIDQAIEIYKPDIVAISSVSQNYDYALKYASIAKYFNKKVIMGGIHISSMPVTFSSDMDIGVIGEGEETFSLLLQAFANTDDLLERDLTKIDGIIYWKEGVLNTNTPRQTIKFLDQIPHPDRSLIGYQKHEYMFTSRGCPYNCVFCASSRYWDNVRFCSPEYVLEEIEELVEHGVKMISFYDDLFIANKKRLIKIKDLIISKGFHREIKFSCSCRANLVTQDVADILSSMNVVSVGLGLESGSEKTLQFLKGNIKVQDNWNAVNYLKSAGIQTNASFVIGSPLETREDMMETYDFIKKSSLDFVDIYILTPYPETPVWNYAQERGLIPENLEWNRLNVNFDINKENAIILSEVLDYSEIVKIYNKFRRLRFWRLFIALPRSPWLLDLPKIAYNKMKEYILRVISEINFRW